MGRGVFYFGMLALMAVGVWAGVNYAGTEADPWIKRGLGALMILAGLAIFFASDPVDQRTAQLHGAGFASFGVSALLPEPWRLPMSVLALGLMGAAYVRRRRRLAGRPQARGV